MGKHAASKKKKKYHTDLCCSMATEKMFLEGCFLDQSVLRTLSRKLKNYWNFCGNQFTIHNFKIVTMYLKVENRFMKWFLSQILENIGLDRHN